jgi:hypothetical protein
LSTARLLWRRGGVTILLVRNPIRDIFNSEVTVIEQWTDLESAITSALRD